MAMIGLHHGLVDNDASLEHLADFILYGEVPCCCHMVGSQVHDYPWQIGQSSQAQQRRHHSMSFQFSEVLQLC